MLGLLGRSLGAAIRLRPAALSTLLPAPNCYAALSLRAPRPALAPPSVSVLTTQIAQMGIRSSPAVKEWVSKQDPVLFEPTYPKGRYRSPKLSRRKQAVLIKKAIKKGQFKLEPTVMRPMPRMKGHKRERNLPMRQALVASKMAEMDKMVAEYRAERKARREKWRQLKQFK